MTLDEGYAGPRLRNALWPSAEPAPYLPVLGSPSIRIDQAPPPPDLVTRPAPAAPPVPALTPTESTVAVANADAARSTTAPSAAAPTDAAPVDAATPAASTLPPPPPPAKTPAPILPDNLHPVVHPEDFLPYFQIPGTGHPDVIVAPGAPAPAPIPASSATYTQTK